MTTDELDRQLRSRAQSAAREIYATPVERRSLEQRQPTWAPLALAAALAAVIAVGAPLYFGHALRGGTAGQNQPAEVTKAADTILVDMTTAMSHLHAFHMVERGTASDGGPVVIDLRLDHVGNALESWTMGGQTDTVLIWHSDLFAKGPHVVPAAWQSTVGERWVVTKSADLAPTLVATISPARIISCFTGDHGTLTKDGERTVNGQRTIRLVSTATSPQAVAYTLDVAIDGRPYALHFETDAGPSSRPDCQGPSNPSSTVPSTPADASTGHEIVDFSDFESADLLSPPSDYVDAAALATPTP